MKKTNKTTIIVSILLVIVGIGLILFYVLNNINLVKKPVPENTRGKITLKYFEGYNYTTGEAINDTIPLNVVNISDADCVEIMKEIDQLKEVNDTCEGLNDCFYYFDEYLLKLSNGKELYIAEDYSKYVNENKYYKTSDALYKKIREIVMDYNKKHLYKRFDSTFFTIIDHRNDKTIEITDDLDVIDLTNYHYYEINGKDEDFKDEKIGYTINLTEGRSIDVYSSSVLAKINYQDGTYKYIFVYNLDDVLTSMLERY